MVLFILIRKTFYYSITFHFVDLWHHVLLSPKKEDGKWLIEAQTGAFNKNFLNSNNEGEVDCIVRLPLLITANLNGDVLTIRTKNEGDVDSSFTMPSFYMDKFPVTNIQFKKFIDNTHYKPTDITHFLKHWTDKKIPAGMENFPVVYVSYEDTKA